MLLLDSDEKGRMAEVWIGQMAYDAIEYFPKATKEESYLLINTKILRL